MQTDGKIPRLQQNSRQALPKTASDLIIDEGGTEGYGLGKISA